MKTLTGFYNMNSLNTHEKEIEFMKEAIFLSYEVVVESKYVRKGTRELEKSLSIQEALDACSNIKCVDRSIQLSQTQYGQVSIMTGNWKTPLATYDPGYGSGWMLLNCFMNLNNLKKLTKKYKLKME